MLITPAVTVIDCTAPSPVPPRYVKVSISNQPRPVMAMEGGGAFGVPGMSPGRARPMIALVCELSRNWSRALGREIVRAQSQAQAVRLIVRW
jgi:hypothetical protein